MEKLLHCLLICAAGFLACLGSLAWGQPPVTKLAEMHTQEAQAYRIFVDEQRLQPWELDAHPVFSDEPGVVFRKQARLSHAKLDLAH